MWAEIWRGKQMMQGILLKRIKHSFKDILTLCVQLFETPWTVVCQAPLSIGFSRQEYWSGLPFFSPGEPPDPRVELIPLASPALAGRLFTTAPPGKPHEHVLSLQ